MTQFDTLTDILTARHSCRAFRPDPVPRADVEAVLRAAQRVPSWCNAQPWQVGITSPERTDALRTALQDAFAAGASPDIPFPEGYTGHHRNRRRACGWQLYEAVGVEKGDREGSAREMMKNYDFFGAPHVAMISSGRELGTYGAIDCGGFVTAFTLAAQARGIATVAQAAPAAFSPALHDFFGLGEDRLALCMISFGYSDTDHPANSFRTARAPLDEWVDWQE
ncbi:nitroreductase [Maritimibacter sp. UBA3975]|uniref:nitroreductase n=1 Tax=Maritimibacter sp. UBA3975 TaxID=1946833 RepID=UPI000C09F6F6|nr:nitroreductase [Maritimibacter sp. UBA3975]MAM62678.1 nitroreductase [Maritimibacter sp.]|tara:strand:- start:74 stop:742 length:669 start_codon:yes stop_codon:yes gene_type:complete